MSKIEPQIDPWELMVEHNQRIQKLELLLQQQARNSEELAKAINNCFELQQVNQRTIDRLLTNQQLNAEIMAQVLLNTPQKPTT
jgi:hypothetical protein